MVLVNGLEVWCETPPVSSRSRRSATRPDVGAPGRREPDRGVRVRALADAGASRCRAGSRSSRRSWCRHGAPLALVGWRLVAPAAGSAVRAPAPLGPRLPRAAPREPRLRLRAARRTTASGCASRPTPACPRSSSRERAATTHAPDVVPPLRVRRGARARPRRGRGPRLARRAALRALGGSAPRSCSATAGTLDGDATRAAHAPTLCAPTSASAAPTSRRAAPPRRRRLPGEARLGPDDRRGLSVVHRLGPRHVHRAARAVPRRPAGSTKRATILLRVGRRGVGGHAAQPLPRRGRGAGVQRGRRLALVSSSPSRDYSAAMRPRRRRAERGPLREARSTRSSTATPRGTRFGIRADADGLLAAGVPGMQLTWMDAQDRRPGRDAADRQAGRGAGAVAERARGRRALERSAWPRDSSCGRAAFAARFWNEDARLRCTTSSTSTTSPAPSMRAFRRQPDLRGRRPAARSSLEGERAPRVVDAVEARLWTPLGLRSLAPGAPGYAPHYARRPARARRARYHQGTRVAVARGPVRRGMGARAAAASRGGEREARERFLAPLLDAALETPGSATCARSPTASRRTTPGGCPFQAWSLGELLRLREDVFCIVKLAGGDAHNGPPASSESHQVNGSREDGSYAQNATGSHAAAQVLGERLVAGGDALDRVADRAGHGDARALVRRRRATRPVAEAEARASSARKSSRSRPSRSRAPSRRRARPARSPPRAPAGARGTRPSAWASAARPRRPGRGRVGAGR